MKLLNHFNINDKKYLKVINQEWPFQFLSEFSSFNLAYYAQPIFIVFDEKLNAFMPIKFYKFKLFQQAQIQFAPMRNGVELNADEQLQFFNQLQKFLYYKANCERIAQPHPYAVLAAVPNDAKYCEFGTYIVDLHQQSDEQILSGFHPKYQKAVSHSLKNGAIIKIGPETLPDFFTIYKSTMSRIQKPYDHYEYFTNLLKYMGEGNICSAVVYDDQGPVSGIFLIHTKFGAFLTHAGTMGESKLYGAAKLLNYEVMKHLKNIGVKRYDFVGVRLKNENNPELEGVFRFKKGFGGELKEGYLWKYDLLPMKAKLFDMMVTLRAKGGKSADIIDQVNR
jgi:hypothetical protein